MFIRLLVVMPSTRLWTKILARRLAARRALSLRTSGKLLDHLNAAFLNEDSNYWTAAMFFKHENGSYQRVPIMQNTALPNGINGGMTIYYTQNDFNNNGKQKITAFPKVCALFTFHVKD
jgi:hypothetical protein